MWPHSQQLQRDDRWPAARLRVGTWKPRKQVCNSNLLAGARSCPDLHSAAACPRPEALSVHLLGVQTLMFS